MHSEVINGLHNPHQHFLLLKIVPIKLFKSVIIVWEHQLFETQCVSDRLTIFIMKFIEVFMMFKLYQVPAN